MLSIEPAGRLPDSDTPWTVAWRRGHSCQWLAEALGDEPATRLDGDPHRTCFSRRIDLVVTPRLTSFDLVAMAVPQGLEVDGVDGVSAAVSDGPHSDLAAAVAARVADHLGVPGEIVTLYRNDEEQEAAKERLQRIGDRQPSLERREIEAPEVRAIIESLAPSTVLVLGAPGGSWLQRQFFGPGHRLAVSAPGGAIVVRSAPRRCFHAMSTIQGRAAAPQLAAAEAVRLYAGPVIPVAEAGRLVGVARTQALLTAPEDASVGDIMEPPVAVEAGEALDAAHDLFEYFDGGAVPVVDDGGSLLGVIQAPM